MSNLLALASLALLAGAGSGLIAAIFRLALQRADHWRDLLIDCAHIADWLASQRRRGSITLDDAEQAADMLRGIMAMEPQRAALLGQVPTPDASAIAARAKVCAKIFLEGCRA